MRTVICFNRGQRMKVSSNQRIVRWLNLVEVDFLRSCNETQLLSSSYRLIGLAAAPPPVRYSLDSARFPLPSLLQWRSRKPSSRSRCTQVCALFLEGSGLTWAEKINVWGWDVQPRCCRVSKEVSTAMLLLISIIIEIYGHSLYNFSGFSGS